MKINVLNITISRLCIPSFRKKNFPLGHPTIYIDDECNDVDMSNFIRLIKCSILPPKSLFFPILPMRIDGKLIFALCHTCAIQKQINCTHSDDKRMLTGTWTSVEIQKAVDSNV